MHDLEGFKLAVHEAACAEAPRKPSSLAQLPASVMTHGMHACPPTFLWLKTRPCLLPPTHCPALLSSSPHIPCTPACTQPVVVSSTAAPDLQSTLPCTPSADALRARSFYDREAPIYTMSRFLPPSKVQAAQISKSILGDGCVVRAGARVHHSVVGLRCLIAENCVVEDSLLMGSDYYETMEECALIPGCLPMGVGETPRTPLRGLARQGGIDRCEALELWLGGPW